jgi:hypothetical protein
MAYPKKHVTNWFTTSAMRAINLALVTDVRLIKRDNSITGATVYVAGADRNGEAAISIDAEDATRLLDLLV